MARIAGVDIPKAKKVGTALTYIYGIGPGTAQKILAEARVSPDLRTSTLTESAAIFIRLAEASGVVSSFYRTAIAACLLFFPFAVNKNKKKQKIGLKSAAIAAAGGLIFAADLALWSSGIVLGGATNPTLMANTAPLWVGLGSLLFFHEKSGRGFWAGLWLALAGVMVVLGQDLALAMEFGGFPIRIAGSGILRGVFPGYTGRPRAPGHLELFLDFDCQLGGGAAFDGFLV